jgi:hypothetical protein
MGRSLTPEEKNVRAAMIELLALYYLLRDIEKKKWFNTPVIQEISRICYLVLPGFKFIKFNRQDNRMHFYLGDLTGGGHLHLPEKQLVLFIKIMSAFQSEYASMEFFKIVKVNYSFSISPEEDSSTKTTKWTKPKAKSRQDGKLELDISRDSFVDAKFDSRLEYPPDYAQVFHVLPLYYQIDDPPVVKQQHRSELVDLLFPRQPSPLIQIPTPCMDTKTDDFIDLVRYVFVKYRHMFGGFEHIKTCGYSRCRKLYMEIKGRKRDAGFCRRSNCRSMHFREKDPDRYKCRDRQNAWISKKIKNEKIIFRKQGVLPGYRIYQEDCEACKLYHLKGVRCPKLIEKNKTAMEVIEDHYASKKSKNL